MSRFRHLVQELHRRSLWQVLGVYIVGSWVALQVVDVLTSNFGLPDWVPPFALVLLVIGLPVVLATAFVQEGAPSGQTWSGPASSVADSTALLEGEPRPVLSGEEQREARAGAGAERADDTWTLESLFTWRNAVLGGVGAAMVLGLAVAAYFTMWATGVGPVGSLVAQGVLDEREQVVLAEFENSTPDPTLGEVVTDAFRVDLVRSPILAPVGPAYVSRVLERMNRDPGDRLTPALARELAQREGIKAVVQGEVAAAGPRYVLTASLTAADDGETLAAFRETAESAGDIIDAVDRLSRRLREKAGESLPSIKGGEPLRTVTTGSLEALRLYSRALREIEAGDHGRAVALLEEALEVDPEFAMAHRQLGALYRNRRQEEKAIEAVTRAYELRDRLTDRERYLAEALYHQFVTEDREQTVQAYRNVLDVAPGEARALNNLGVLYGDAGEGERAAEMYRRAVDTPEGSATAYGNLIQVLVNLGRADEALEVARDFGERYGHDHSSVRFFAQRAAAFAGEWERADSLAAVRLRDVEGSGGFIHFEIALYDQARGRFRAAEGHLDDAGATRDGELPERGALWEVVQRSRIARERAGDAEALSAYHGRMTAGLRALRDSTPRVQLDHAAFYARAGRPDSARALLARIPAETEVDGLDALRAVRLILRAELALAEERFDEAIELAREGDRHPECPNRCGLVVAARAHQAAGRPDSAAVAYEAWVEAPFWDWLSEYLTRRAPVLEELCRLHDEVGRREEALERCREFVELWSDADPEVQPRVERARERLARLSG